MADDHAEDFSIIRTVAAIPRQCGREEFQNHLRDFLNAVRRSLPHERVALLAAIDALRSHPHATTGLVEHYQSFGEVGYRERFTIVQILGALRHDDAAAFLASLIWRPLPPRLPRVKCRDTSPYALEVRVRAKATHGLAFRRTPPAYADCERIMLEHESTAVRVAAIDAYAWNQGDSRQARERLYAILPQAFHPYVERPRFHRGMDIDVFELCTLQWMRRWCTDGRLPPNPHFHKPPPRRLAEGV